MLKGPVIGGFSLVRKTAAGKLSHLKMISDTLAANPLFFAGFVATVAFFQVLLLVTFHNPLLLSIKLVIIHALVNSYQMIGDPVNGMKKGTTMSAWIIPNH